METNTQQEEQSPKKGTSRKGKWLLFLLLILVLVLAGGTGVLLWKRSAPQPKSQYELDANALAGFLPGRSQEEIEAELNRIIEKGFFNVSINPTPVIETDKTMNLNIENVPANHYLMQVNVYLLDKNNKETLLYRSGIIKPGFHIGTVTVSGNLPAPGQYNGRADFSALYPDTQENIGQTSATMLITVKGGS